MEKKNAHKITHIVGIDEVGRGPLAGPVAVCAVCVPIDFDWGTIPLVGDSKKVSVKNREAIFHRAYHMRRQRILNYSTAFVDVGTVDEKGITYAIKEGVKQSIRRLRLDPATIEVRLDGLLKAPSQFLFQETIIHGDQKELIIGLASILAKVTRDRYMVRLSKKYPHYEFERHKGYGTRDHCVKLELFGLSPVHRRSFCTRWL